MAQGLSLDWAFGFNRDIVGGVHNLSDETRSAIFYVSAHSGVIYDYAAREQRLLQGHCNPITSCCVSEDKRWIVTADAGPDSILVIWDSLTATPVKTIFNPHPGGIIALDLSPDAMFLVTLGAPVEGGEPQTIALWEWTNKQREDALYTAEVATDDVQHSVHFNSGDIREVVTNGKERVIFWSWEQRKFDYYSPPLSQRDFKQSIGAFTQSVFIPDSSQALTATVDGDLILWGGVGGGGGVSSDGSARGANEKRAIKIIRVSGSDAEGSAIWFVSAAEGYLVLGSDDGAVRFFDYQFRLVAWFEDLEAGPVTSISFANTRPPAPMDSTSETPFTVPDFVVGTKKAFVVGVEAALFEEIRAENRRGTLLAQGLDDEVHGLAAHPFLPQLAVSCYSGTLQLWDYEAKRLLMVRPFDARKVRPHCLAFDANGRFLAMGCTSGVLKVLDAASLDDISTFRSHLSVPSNGASLIDVQFSPDSQYMAVASSDHHVAIWRFGIDSEKEKGLPENEEPAEEWIYLGRIKAHSKPITGLSFTLSADQLPLLVSVGEDKRMVQYSLQKSSAAEGIHMNGGAIVTDQSARPTACTWHPMLQGTAGGIAAGEGELILVANDEYKVKAWHGAERACVRTAQGQTFGGPVNRMQALPVGAGPPFVAYSSANKVIGLMQLPLDGNPNKTMGLVAHPGEITGLAVTFDGRFVITAGGSDATVNLWATNTAAVEQAVAEGGGDAAPFLRLLDGGAEGAFYNELVDFFYYAQIQSQGEDSTEARAVDGQVPLSCVPDLMRALGFYPTELEVQNMLSEVTRQRQLEGASTPYMIGQSDFIKLFINHRPVFGTGKEQIADAFNALGAAESGGTLNWEELSKRLQTEGETMTEAELQKCLGALVGDEDLPVSLSHLDFADKVLGFQDYAAEDEDQPVEAEE